MRGVPPLYASNNFCLIDSTVDALRCKNILAIINLTKFVARNPVSVGPTNLFFRFEERFVQMILHRHYLLTAYLRLRGQMKSISYGTPGVLPSNR